MGRNTVIRDDVEPTSKYIRLACSEKREGITYGGDSFYPSYRVRLQTIEEPRSHSRRKCAFRDDEIRDAFDDHSTAESEDWAIELWPRIQDTILTIDHKATFITGENSRPVL